MSQNVKKKKIVKSTKALKNIGKLTLEFRVTTSHLRRLGPSPDPSSGRDSKGPTNRQTRVTGVDTLPLSLSTEHLDDKPNLL